MATTPVIPTNIVVHLGRPDEPARNVTVPFVDYVKNVASSEIYPTWPDASLRANIYAITTFALNRVYNEHYRSKGYDFDITSSTQYDQAYNYGREIFGSINTIVDEIFNDYVVKEGKIDPYFTQFCNGVSVTCDGLSQWGTVDLANRGLSPYEILIRYYGRNINIKKNAPVEDIDPSYPGFLLGLGDSGNEVLTVKRQLSRIRQNFPAIPRVSTQNPVFDTDTERAVRVFQGVFNLVQDGKVGKSTWYKLREIFNGVKRLSELTSEGITLQEISPVFSEDIRRGDRGNEVEMIQYYLAVIGYFNPSIPVVNIDGIFGKETEDAVFSFQSEYGLPVTGIVSRLTWSRMRGVYNDVVNSLPEWYYKGEAKIYPGYVLSRGLENSSVRDLQTYLRTISSISPKLIKVPVTGFFGTQTEEAVKRFQKLYGIPVTGTVGPVTWNRIALEYNNYYR